MHTLGIVLICIGVCYGLVVLGFLTLFGLVDGGIAALTPKALHLDRPQRSLSEKFFTGGLPVLLIAIGIYLVVLN